MKPSREAFWNQYVPRCNEHYLLHIMRKADSFIHELDIVAEVNGKVVGNIFGPISVLPTFQGIGSKTLFK